ncbi:histidine triad nucleotide-binding protein [Berryella wangjianweii]|uniref:Histidine triad nucleotide-binding protein n=1 Tax=Berryella wangjianweii TaxID=2734634 RepID=A0A6M8J648_9ACTN|nr:histidine triad nucleotide-binding protein [Berryella wangjianweii]QKF06939.1 histidine triad nucleotide-binding protein [Berryella wangjianweii]
MSAQDCLFCKIVAGDIPCTKVYEDEWVLAFDDIAPHMPVHTLVVPKAHYDSIADDVPAEVLARVFAAVPEVARIKGVNASGFRTLANTGQDACQTVGHLHVHVLGGAPMNSGNPSL